ncbi:hypothetical protein VEE31_10170 [Escherichia coli]|nr:hypothetical protein VEE31_10170 [Escherichia coli]
MCNLLLYGYFKFSIQSVGYVIFFNTAASWAYGHRNFLLHSWGYVRFPDIKWGVMVFIFVVIT